VVNDGSKNGTRGIAKKLADIVVELPDIGYSKLGTRKLPWTFNAGLRRVSLEATHVIICGADNILPLNFAEVILEEMRKDPKLVIASGHHKDDKVGPGLPPRGTRMVDAEWWRRLKGHRYLGEISYPERLGWETWLLYMAKWKGFKTLRVPGLITTPQRPTVPTQAKQAFTMGKSMKRHGNKFLYVVLRAMTFVTKHGPKRAIELIAGYLSTTEQFEYAKWLSKHQGKLLIQMLKSRRRFRT